MNTPKRYLVASSPHIGAREDTRSIMLDVIIALCPALVVAVYFFGWRALMVTLITVASAVLFEFLFCKIMKKPQAVYDLSAVVTGLILGLNLPVSVPFWIGIVGSAFAILIVKQLYGGIGKNFMNPALAARVFLFSWPDIMASAPDVFNPLPVFSNAVDVITSATPLASMRQGVLPNYSLMEMLLGQHGGCIGETSSLILLMGGAYLVLRKVITPRIPLFYLGTVALLTFLFPRGGIAAHEWMLYQLLSGGLILGAVFMATDYTTSPITKTGKAFFGIGCGLLTILIRYFGSYYEGVSFAILIMNSCTWLFDKISKPRRFGTKKAGKAA